MLQKVFIQLINRVIHRFLPPKTVFFQKIGGITVEISVDKLNNEIGCPGLHNLIFCIKNGRKRSFFA